MSIPIDKIQHLILGMAVASTVTLYAGVFFIPVVAICLGIACGIIVGAAKEFWDMRGHGTPDFMDFAMTALGALIILPLAFI